MTRNSDRIAELQQKLSARRGKPGFKDNCAAIEAEIARLESACPDCGRDAPSPRS